ncbi:hypothetical protein ACGC1H_005177 [Rhizoctonia solani]
MPPRKKTRSTLKRSSSDLADDHVNPKRPRADDGEVGTSNISLDTAAAPRARKPTTYKSKARQKAGLGIASPPRLTNFGFNLENKPKLGRALFHLSPSPRAKAKRSKVFASPKASRRRSKAKGGANTSAETSRLEITVDEKDGEEQDQGPEESTSMSTLSDMDDEADQPRPLPVLSAIRPIEGPGLEIRTPLVGRVIPTLQSLSKRAQTTPIPLFAATPRQPVSQLSPIVDDDNNPPPSPTKSNIVPIFAPTPSHAPPVPSTPAHKPRSIPIFTPSVHRTQESPTKKFPPVFAPTENSLTSITTPAHPNTLPTAPPKLPAFSAALPATDIPETPTTKGRSLPTFTPKLLFPPPIVEESQERAPVSRVSKAPAFGGVLEDEESTPRASRQAEQPQQTLEMQVEKAETKQVGEVEPEQTVEGETKPVEEDEPADVSMADLFNNSTIEFTPRSERVLCSKQGFFAPPQAQDEPECIPSSQPSERVESSQPVERDETFQPEIKHNSLLGARMTRSRSRSESAPASGSATRGGSVAPSRAGSVALSGADSQAPQAKAPSRAPSLIPENESVVPKSRRNSVAPKSRENSVPPKKRSRSRSVVVETPVPATSSPPSASLLTQIVTDQPILAALKSQVESGINSMDEYRTSQTAALMMDTPADAGTPSVPPDDSMNPETSPLSSVPDDMSFSFMNHGDTTAGDTTMRDAGDATVRQDQDGDTSMQIRDSAATPASPPFSPPAPTSPVSSLPASPDKRPLPSSSPTRPGETTASEHVMAPISGVVVPVAGFPRSHSRSSSLTSLSDLSDEHDDKPMEVEELIPAEHQKSMIPVAKRPGTPGPPPRPPTPGKVKTPFGARTDTGIANRMTPGPSRNGVGMSLASVKKSGIPTPGPAKNGLFGSSSRPAGFLASTSTTAALGLGKPTAASRSALPARTRSGATKARSLAAPTASTAAKARTKVVTAPPPPRSRITSFMKPNSTVNRPPPSSSSAIVPPSVPAGTNPSPRKGQSKDDSDLPGPRRSMISQDTQASLSSLSNALEKLARPSLGNSRSGFPPRPGTSMGFVPPPRPGSSLGFAEKRATGGDLGSSAGPGASKPVIKPPSTSTAKGKAKAKETGDDATYEDSSKKVNDDPNAPLRSCVIFVDVRTADGEDAGSLFVDMLKGLGAKVCPYSIIEQKGAN